MIRSEFDTYLNLTYIKLGSIGHYCLENNRFLKSCTWSEALDNTEAMTDKTEQLATDAINLDDIDMLNIVDKLSSGLEALDAKMELSLYCPLYELN